MSIYIEGEGGEGRDGRISLQWDQAEKQTSQETVSILTTKYLTV